MFLRKMCQTQQRNFRTPLKRSALMSEADLETAHRQVARGAMLIERQKVLIDDLRVSGQMALADKAEELLHELMLLQAHHLLHVQKLMEGTRRSA
jgi:hypothetical protein